jgi:hypothetical protein
VVRITSSADLPGKLDLDAAGVAGDRLVHRIVEDLGREMVHSPLVRAPDIHAGSAPNRLQPFEYLDILGRVAAVEFCPRCVKEIGHERGIYEDAGFAQAAFSIVPSTGY